MAIEELHEFRDSLTGFHSRETFADYLHRQTITAQTQHKVFSLLILDIDHFKLINDKYGHIYGDEALKFFAEIINEVIRGEYFVARYGGDEFIIVMNDSGQKEALDIARRIKGLLNKRFFICKERPLLIKTSIGVAIFPSDATSASDLLKKADEALYFAKKHGRNKIVLSTKLRFFSGRLRYIKIRNIVSVIAVALLLYAYQTHYKNLLNFKKIYSNIIIGFNYGYHKLKYKYNFGSFELDNNSTIKGWIVREGSDKIYITPKYLGPEIVEIPKKRIRVFIKIKK
jgi:diguanylate cyclase (GGDEF)-like protein